MVHPFVCNQEESDKIMTVHCQGSELRSRNRKMKLGPRVKIQNWGLRQWACLRTDYPQRTCIRRTAASWEREPISQAGHSPEALLFPFFGEMMSLEVRQCQHTGHSVLPSCGSPWGVQSRTHPLAGPSTAQVQYIETFLRAHTWPTWLAALLG